MLRRYLTEPETLHSIRSVRVALNGTPHRRGGIEPAYSSWSREILQFFTRPSDIFSFYGH